MDGGATASFIENSTPAIHQRHMEGEGPGQRAPFVVVFNSLHSDHELCLCAIMFVKAQKDIKKYSHSIHTNNYSIKNVSDYLDGRATVMFSC